MNLDLERMSKLEIIQQMNKLYHSECKNLLVSLYDSFISDTLSLEDFEEIGANYGVDVQEGYRELIRRKNLEDDL